EIIENLSVLTDCKFELIEGKIYPKEGSDPIPQAIIDYILSPNFDISEIHKIYDMPRTSISHRKLIAKINLMIADQIKRSEFGFYLNDMTVKAKFLGSFFVPDITFTLVEEEIYDENGHLENPYSIIEFLSPSTERKDRNEKKEDFLANESLQEYVLISQDCYKIEQFLREGIFERRTNQMDYKNL
ncbi:MAG: Uma2 family endonuclease, partial [Bacteroidetes bacterium]